MVDRTIIAVLLSEVCNSIMDLVSKVYHINIVTVFYLISFCIVLDLLNIFLNFFCTIATKLSS